MITSPSASALRNSDIFAAWESASCRNSSSASVSKPPLLAAPPSDPLRQAKRLPIKVLKMLTARSGHILHPEYLQPLPSTPVSPIEVRRRFSAAIDRHFRDCLRGVYCFVRRSQGSRLLLFPDAMCPVLLRLLLERRPGD